MAFSATFTTPDITKLFWGEFKMLQKMEQRTVASACHKIAQQ
jgi:hypothetical protein